MAITINKREERIRHGRELRRLNEAVTRGKVDNSSRAQFIATSKPLYVPPAHPFYVNWRGEYKMERLRVDGWEVVSAEDGEKLYRIPRQRIDPTNNCCRYGGEILMRCPIDRAAGLKAAPILAAIDAVESNIDVDAFRNEVGSMAREVDHKKGLVKRRRMGQVPDEEKVARNYNRLMTQIARDQASQAAGLPIAATPQMMEDAGALLPRGVVINEGVREVWLTDDPTRPLDFDFA